MAVVVVDKSSIVGTMMITLYDGVLCEQIVVKKYPELGRSSKRKEISISSFKFMTLNMDVHDPMSESVSP